MQSQPLWALSASALHSAYRQRTLTPTTVALTLLQRVEQLNPKLNAVIAQRREGFLLDAQASTHRFAVQAPLGDLDGIPLTIKDNLLTHDMPTTWGSLGLRRHHSPHDELPVARARAAGGLILGKTNVPEFTLEGYTGNPVFGVTRNPWDPALTPGGSSGGAVAGLAAGLFPLALGTDGGGSIRRPASHCGVVGLKPSIGALAREQGLPQLLLDFEVVGPMARTVADVRLAYCALRGPSAGDRSSLAAHAAQQASAAQHAGRGRAPLRILYVPRLGDAPVDPQINASVREAAQRLEALGHRVNEATLPLDLGFINEAWPQVGQIGLAALFARHPDWAEQASPKYLQMAKDGAALPAHRLWRLLEVVEQLRREAAKLFTRFDVVLMPAAAALPWPAETAFPPEIDGQTVGPRGHAVFTGWVNAAGLPAVAMPCRPASNGLPIGLQLIGAYGAEELLLDLAAQHEHEHPWSHLWPAIAQP